MTPESITQQALALPLAQRVDLAEALWQSLGEGLDEGEEREAIERAKRRAGELADGTVTGRSHEEVMAAARRSIE